MSARRVGEGKIELPPNPTWIDIPFSDGDPSTWPTNTTRAINSDGQVNFMEAQELNAYSALRWRIGVGKAIAAEMNMPEGPGYVLRQWPDNYRMFDHNKGTPDNPRHDIYLFGSTKAKKFRSVNEFIPHAIWLYRDYSRGGPPCQCKYCSKTKHQKEITATLSVYRSSPISSSPISSTNKPRVIRDKTKTHELHANRERQRDQKVYASVQKAIRPVNPNSLPPNVSSHVLKQPMVAERNADLRAITAKTSMSLKRWFREGELVFCAVNPPIVGSSPDAVINVWPGIIEQTKLKSIPVPRHDNVPSGSGNTTTAPTNISNGTPSGVVLEHDSSNEPSWSVQQSNMYKIQLLAVCHSYVAQDDQVIPYQAYNMPDQLLHALKEHGLHLDREQMKDFNPFPSVSGPPPNFADAISPFVVAMQIGTELSKFFSLLDEYDFQYEVQPPPRTPIPPPQSATSLQSAIEAAGRHNAQTGIASASTSSEVILPHVTERRTQLRFQGMWWGAERIWADDFVRIKLARNAVAPNGNDEIYPPSGPGKSTIEYAIAHGEDPSVSGAGSRGVFMRLEAFYIEDFRSSSGGHIQKEVRARGMLYELADIDWEEPEDQARMQSSSSSTAATRSDPSTVTALPPSTSLPGPSPLKPPPLPNPGPSVPVPSTSASILANFPPTPNPATSLHALFPEAPPGYRFRQILPDDCEACVSLSLISGRYYPGILKHPMLKPIVEEAKSPSKDVRLGNYLWALEGLTAGFFNSVDAEYYRKSRVTMMDDADKNAMAILEGLLEQSRQREDSVMSDGHEPTAPDDSMDVDS